MPDPKLPDSAKGWVVVIIATIAALIAEYVVIKCLRKWLD